MSAVSGIPAGYLSLNTIERLYILFFLFGLKVTIEFESTLILIIKTIDDCFHIFHNNLHLLIQFYVLPSQQLLRSSLFLELLNQDGTDVGVPLEQLVQFALQKIDLLGQMADEFLCIAILTSRLSTLLCGARSD